MNAKLNLLRHKFDGREVLAELKRKHTTVPKELCLIHEKIRPALEDLTIRCQTPEAQSLLNRITEMIFDDIEAAILP